VALTGRGGATGGRDGGKGGTVANWCQGRGVLRVVVAAVCLGADLTSGMAGAP
jgi:hypothetical protein